MPPDLSTVPGLEERAFNAWPALETVIMGGWLLRFADGYTKRANSVNALAPVIGVDQILAMAAPLYAARGQRLVFRLSPLAGPAADPALERLGFQRLDETIVMTAALDGDAPPDPEVAIERRLQDAWSHAFAAANSVPARHRATHDRMLAGLRLPSAFASLRRDGRQVCWGLGVVERGMIGLFDIVTAADVRRQGAARRLVVALMAWGRSQGATSAYLQVVAGNSAAILLYESLGFREAYRYHYRIPAGL